jgi:hypothetical protein
VGSASVGWLLETAPAGEKEVRHRPLMKANE